MGKTSEHPFMPYVPRGCQDDIIKDITRTLDEGRHIVLESGTGTGKTIVSLAGALEHAKPRGKRIVYATRTVSQSDQVMRELKAIRRISEVSGIVVTGRGRSCPKMRGIQGMDSIPPHVQYAMCQEMRRTGRCGMGQSPDPALMARLCDEEFPTSGEFDMICSEQGLCPYEARRSMLGRTDVVAVPYAYVLSKEIRDYFLAGVSDGDPGGMTLIIDEAHNFAEHAREFESFAIDSKLVKSAMESCKDGMEIMPGIPLKEFIGAFWDRVRSEATENIGLGQSEHMFGKEGPETWLMERFSLDRYRLDVALSRMAEIGEAETAAMIEGGKPGASPIELLGVKLKLWCDGASERYVRSVRVDSDGEYLRAACIDIADVSDFLRSVPGAVHMSGTLHPLDQYARVLGLPDTARCRTYPSPFPPENRKVIYSTKVTTRYSVLKNDPTMTDRICNSIVRLCEASSDNTMVFFTSYSALRTFRPRIEKHVSRPSYWEDGDAKSTLKSLKEFKSNRGGVFFSVIGGSVAEGIDFPGDELRFVIIVGIPYTPPSCELDAVSRKLDERYGEGKGWAYASEVPAVRRMNQAIGRMIRTETDSGLAVILDSRAYRYERDLDAVPSDDPVSYARRFFSRRRHLRTRRDNVITVPPMGMHAEPVLSAVQEPPASGKLQMPLLRSPCGRRLGQQADLPVRRHGAQGRASGAQDHQGGRCPVHAVRAARMPDDDHRGHTQRPGGRTPCGHGIGDRNR